MSTSLPQEVQTSKVTTLPDDLKAIAEEMLKEKFGVKEEVVEQSTDSFRSERPPRQSYDADESYVRGEWGQRGDIKVEIRPWDRRRTAQVKIHHPSYSGIKEAAMRLRRENLPLDRAEMLLSPMFWNHIRASRELERDIQFSDRYRHEGEKPVVAQLFGMDVIVHPAIRDGYIEVVF